MIYDLTLNQHICTSYHFVNSAKTQFSHYFAQFFCHEEEIFDYMFWLTCEFFAQLRILSGNPNRTGIKVAFAHHDTADSNQWNSRKPKFFCTQHGCNCYVSACFKLAVSLQSYSSTQLVQHQCLVSFRYPQFPWYSGMLY